MVRHRVLGSTYDRSRTFGWHPSRAGSTSGHPSPIRLFLPSSDPINADVEAWGRAQEIEDDKHHFVLEPGPLGAAPTQITFPPVEIPRGARFLALIKLPADAACRARFVFRVLDGQGQEQATWREDLSPGESRDWVAALADCSGNRRLQLATERIGECDGQGRVPATWAYPRIET